MSVDALKLKLINQIMSLQDAYKLQKLEATLRDMWADEGDMIKKLNKPMRKKIDIEALKKEQGFTPINKKEFFKKIEQLNIEEPLDDLLRMI